MHEETAGADTPTTAEPQTVPPADATQNEGQPATSGTQVPPANAPAGDKPQEGTAE